MTDNTSISSTAASALNQFLTQAKSIRTNESAVDLIKQIIDSPHIYSFSEFLESPEIQKLQNTPDEKYYLLLKLFAYGTYRDYTASRSQLPEISKFSLNKLRHLSIITFASNYKIIPYKLLLDELGIINVRELEDLIIEAFYADIIKGKLDQQNAQLEIDFAIGRDVTDDEIDDILKILNDWRSNCSDVLKTIESEISFANVYKQQQLEIQNNIENEVTNMKKSIKIQSQEVVESLNIAMSKDADKYLKKSFKLKK